MLRLGRHAFIRDIPEDHNALRESGLTESREMHLKSKTFDKDSTNK